ncbi:MAG: ATP-binding cassette domain-containing protein [Paludibacteraceae bacterium]|nr:ATP-binding cassette domain-containing protein [Paludibacteraceae bacterium]
MTLETIINKDIASLEKESPAVVDYLKQYGLQFHNKEQTLGTHLQLLTEETLEDMGIDHKQLLINLEGFIRQQEGSTIGEKYNVKSITLIGGHDKNGTPENITITLHAGTITSIVGPTGSGKSRLLGDIEWMAQADTPTGRKILVNGDVPDVELRFSLEHKLVAQLSQNMNFVIDATAEEFITMHAESRMVQNTKKIVADIIRQANLLAGEGFDGDTPLTSLSGGQSRALMIADTAFLSTSPVVLIDEIENAGIDQKNALQLLVKKEKIVLMATHDPILALMAEQRLVIKNGGIHKIITTSEQEKLNLEELERIDNKILSLRNRLRNGEIIDNIE